MMSNLDHLDVIDLISERHLQLRGIIEEMWNESSDLRVSNSEWFILARIYKKNPTIASISKSVDITRQATHKLVKSLEAKGLLVVQGAESNKKEKTVQLTALGNTSYEEYLSIKDRVIEKIRRSIGNEKGSLLRELLEADWGI